MRLTTCALGFALAGLTAFTAHGQVFPTRNVTILVPFAAGGPTDVIMRILGQRLSARWGKSVIIENRHLVRRDNAWQPPRSPRQ